MGTWSSGLPDIQDNLDLDDGELGTAALFVSLGMTLATFFAAISVRNYGSKYSTMIAGLLLCCSLPGISLSNSFPLLIFTMFIFGFTMGIMDVSMNASGITTEIVYKQTTEIVYKQGIYCTFHGSYSFAMALGSFLGGALTSLSISMLYIFISVSSVLFMLSLLAGHNLYSKGEEAEIISLDSKKLTEKSTNVTFFSSQSSYYLCCIGFLAVFGESNMVTWCIVFLVRYINDSPMVSSIGLSVFMIFMGLGRFNSDRLRAIFGLRVMVFYAGIFATVGGLLIFLSPWFDFSTNNALSISIAFLGKIHIYIYIYICPHNIQ
jgi:MFS family permease